MKKINIIKKNSDFNRIIESKQFIKNRYFVLYYNRNNDKISHFGISVGTKIGNAVTRNKLKRQVRNIIDEDKKYYSNGIDYIIMVRKTCLSISYQEMKESLLKLLAQLENKKEIKK